MADQVSFSTDASGGATPQTPAQAVQAFQDVPDGTQQMQTEGGATPRIPVARPDWLPAKFSSPQDMAKAYAELEAKQGAQPGQIHANPETPAPAPGGDLGTYLEAAANEYDSTGQLSYATQTALAAHGIPPQLQATYIAGLNAQAGQEMQTIHGAVGGEQQWNQMVQWAQQNLQPQEVEAFNAMLNGGTDQAVMAARGLLAQMQGVGPQREPQLLKGNALAANPNRVEPLTEQKMIELMSTPEFKANDPEMHARVDAGLAARIAARAAGQQIR